MTITYSLDVANTRFCGFTKLLCRWKGSIYKILWKELLCFGIAYGLLSTTYRCFLTEDRKRTFEDVVIYCEAFIDLIPLSFVLGFYVSLVVGRWWNQFDAIPWPDRTCLLISSIVHGSDERSRTIRRTLGRYLILLQMLTFQSVSTAFKKRFPTVHHFEEAGLMTREERTIYEQVDIPYGKWWLPAHWFCSLATRAKKEGRIKDSVLLKTLIMEMLNYRSACGTMFNYDWISVPLVYTQVVTLATYTYSLALLMGRQYIDPKRGIKKHEVDLYIPFFTLLQFFFYVGWLKVAEQIVNPYGEDDDDFELNWCLDRNSQIVYMLVDHLHAKHPKLRRDVYWDLLEPQIPHTKFTAKNLFNPQLGSALNLEIDPAKSDFLPTETLLEEDNEANVYNSVKIKDGVRYRPSLLMNILSHAGLGQSVRRKPSRKNESFRDGGVFGHVNPSFVSDVVQTTKSSSSPSTSRRSSIGAKKSSVSPSPSRASSVSFSKGSSFSRHRHKSYDLHQADAVPLPHQVYNSIPDGDSGLTNRSDSEESSLSNEVAAFRNKEQQQNADKEVSAKSTDVAPHMPAIPEEPSRPNSLPNLAEPPTTADSPQGVRNLVAEATRVIEELNRVVSEKRFNRDPVGYESCCSLSSDDEEDTAAASDQDEEERVVTITVDGTLTRTSSYPTPELI